MKFDELLVLVGDEPCFETGALLAGRSDSADVRRQLSRWARAGKIDKLRRGLWVLGTMYAKTRPHPFLLANRMVRASYVSRQSALAHHGMIPEAVPVVTSVTTGRPCAWDTSHGRFGFRHIKKDLFFGYEVAKVGRNEQVFVATPEKAILDLVHLHPGGDDPRYLRELRLQRLDDLDCSRLFGFASRSGIKKLQRCARFIGKLAEEGGYQTI